MPPKASARQPAPKQEGSETQNTSDSRATPAQGSSAAAGPAGRPAVQRLQSLKKRTPAGSIPPAARPPSALGGEPAVKPLKFRPKAVQRRSKEEREALERLEQERNNERLKEAAAIQRGKGTRGRGGAFRGRGGAMGSGAGGPLGSGSGSFRGRGGRSGGGGGGPGGRGGRNRSTLTAASRDGDYDSSDDDLRISIDNINLSEDEDDSFKDAKGKMPSRVGREKGLRPVRVTRFEHEERVVHVNMESSSSKAAEIREQAQKDAAEVVDDKSSTEEERDATPSQPKVKEEPTDDTDTAMEDLPPAEDDGLPKQRYRVRRKTSEPKSSQSPEHIPPTQVKRDPRSLLRTKEELDEYDRHLEDLNHIRELLTHREPEPEPEQEKETEAEAEAPAKTEGEEPQTEGDTTMGEDTEQPEEEEEPPAEKLPNQHLLGHLFLMQFPPMTPNLSIASTQDASAPETSKPEPQAQTEVKAENDEDGDVQITGAAAAGPNGLITAATNWSLPAGRVGKLNVHKSGRVTMDWGGISFELDRAAAVDFVQEALIVSQPEPEEPGQPAKDDARHQAWSMGQLSGKFTVMPNWDDML